MQVGNGIESMKDRASIMKMKLSIYSEKGKGTSIWLKKYKNQINIREAKRFDLTTFSSSIQCMIKVGIVEDNTTLRNSLVNLFNETDGMECVMSLGNLQNIVSELAKGQPDIVLMDIGLPHISGIEGVRTIKSNFSKVQVLMFTVFEDDDKIF